jgi:hypothetical protein
MLSLTIFKHSVGLSGLSLTLIFTVQVQPLKFQIPLLGLSHLDCRTLRHSPSLLVLASSFLKRMDRSQTIFLSRKWILLCRPTAHNSGQPTNESVADVLGRFNPV